MRPSLLLLLPAATAVLLACAPDDRSRVLSGLADDAEEVAALIDEQRDCDAVHRLGDLDTRVLVAAESGTLARDVAGTVRTTLADVAVRLDCDELADIGPGTWDEDAREDAREDAEEAREDAREEAEEPGEQAEEEEAPPQDDGAGSPGPSPSRGSDPPGQGTGRGRRAS